MTFNYYRKADAGQFSFIRIPKALMTEESFDSLSLQSKLLYGMLIDRMGASCKNQWIDEENRVYIINYAKTRDVYVAYRKSGYSKKFFEEHREEITLHKAAKDAFSNLPDKKIPKVKELNAEYAEVLAKKKSAYAEYRQAKKEMQDYVTAKHNIDAFLRAQENEQGRKKQREAR